MILAIYLTGLIVTFFFNLSIDLSIRDQNSFDFKWIIGMIFYNTLWPLTVIYNFVMALYLRAKGKYPLKKDYHK